MTRSRGGDKIQLFNVFQADSYVPICQLTESNASFGWSWNLGPHPAILLFGFFGVFSLLEATGRKGVSWGRRLQVNFVHLFWHYHTLGNIQDHLDTIQTHPRHPPDTLQTLTRRPLKPQIQFNYPLHWGRVVVLLLRITASIQLFMIYMTSILPQTSAWHP